MVLKNLLKIKTYKGTESKLFRIKLEDKISFKIKLKYLLVSISD
jgi:hypothetical protein